MVRKNPLAALLGLGLAVLLLVAAEAPQALRTASAGIFLIREGEVVEEGLYVSGSVVRMAGTIEGDLIVLATDRLDVPGRVEGDVIGFATAATITGVVTGSVRLAGADLHIGADVGGDVVGLGRDISLGGSIMGDSLVWARSLVAWGEVGHDMGGRTFGSTTIGGDVGRDVEMTVGRMWVLEDARVAEDLGYRSAREATIAPGAVIGGTTVHRLPLTPDLRLRAAWLMFGFIAFVLLLAHGLLRIRFRPEQVQRSVTCLARHPAKSLLRGTVYLGFLALPIAVPIAGVVWGSPKVAVAIALAGLAAVPLVGLALLFLVSTAPLPVLIVLGRLISRNRLSFYGSFTLPAVPLALLLLVPYMGIVTGVVVLALGAGAQARANGSRDGSRVAAA